MAEPSVCISFKSKIHSRLQFFDLVVTSVVVGPCFSFMASSLRMDQAVTSMAKLRGNEWKIIVAEPSVCISFKSKKSFKTPVH